VVILDEALVIGKTARGRVQRGQDLEIGWWVDGSEVENPHFSAGGAVAFVDLGGVWRCQGRFVRCDWNS